MIGGASVLASRKEGLQTAREDARPTITERMRHLLMSSLKRHRSRLLVAFLVVGAVVIYLWRNSRVEQSQDNPIRVAAARYGVEPALVKAVVWQESRFNPSVRGR